MRRFAFGHGGLLVGLALALLASVAHAQAPQDGAEPPYQSKIMELADGLRLQYHDFGGSGLAVLFVQDFHDYFGDALDPDWPPFLARFADDFRVLAPVRRGWGASDDTGWGYDVATQSEDLLAFMDALGIERAVLVGRVPADQDMTWIAEHHPERLAGLIYLQSLHVVAGYSNPLIRAFTESYSAGACDMRDPVAQVSARTPWRPHFLGDESARIDVPALRFFWPVFDDQNMNLRRLDRVAELAASPSECASDEVNDYFVALATDEAWQAELRQALIEADLSSEVDRTMLRAFGTNLKTVVAPELDGWEATLDFQYPHMRGFLEEVARVENADDPAPADAAMEATILSRTRDLAASWIRLDLDNYLGRFSDDLVFYFQGSRVPHADFEAIVRETMDVLRESTFEVIDPEVVVLGPDAAVVSFRLREVMVDRSGATMDLAGAMTLVWARHRGEWRVVQAHESLRTHSDEQP